LYFNLYLFKVLPQGHPAAFDVNATSVWSTHDECKLINWSYFCWYIRWCRLRTYGVHMWCL